MREICRVGEMRGGPDGDGGRTPPATSSSSYELQTIEWLEGI